MGDAAGSCEEFLRLRGPHFMQLARGMAPDRHSAEDLFQTAAERLFRRWSALRPLHNPDAYFREILVNAAIDGTRRRRRRPERLVAAVEDARADASTDLGAATYLLEQLARLPPRQRAVVVLRIVEDLDVTATARLLSISEGTVKSALSRGLAALRANLTAPDEGEADDHS